MDAHRHVRTASPDQFRQAEKRGGCPASLQPQPVKRDVGGHVLEELTGGGDDGELGPNAVPIQPTEYPDECPFRPSGLQGMSEEEETDGLIGRQDGVKLHLSTLSPL